MYQTHSIELSHEAKFQISPILSFESGHCLSRFNKNNDSSRWPMPLVKSNHISRPGHLA